MPESVRLAGDPVLRKRCEPITSLPDPALDPLLKEMNLTMLAERGIGLAANQIGVSLRVFILKNETLRGYSEYINPLVLEQSEPTQFEEEGCLSLPGITSTTTRFNKLKLTWFTQDGVLHEEEFTGIRAFAVQHEMDHLNGKLYVDMFGPMKRTLLMDKSRKFVRLRRR